MLNKIKMIKPVKINPQIKIKKLMIRKILIKNRIKKQIILIRKKFIKWVQLIMMMMIPIKTFHNQ